MSRKNWLRQGLCLLAALAVLLCGAMALAEGQTLTAPTFTAADAVDRGEFLEIAITNAADDVWYEAAVFYEDENCNDDVWFGWNGETILLPTANLPSGRTYELCVDACGDDDARASATASFAVNEPQAETHEVFLRLNRTQVLTKELITVSAYAPGATAVRVYAEDGWDWYANGDSLVEICDDGHPGEWDFMAAACYGDPENENDWDEPCEPAHLSVTAPNGPLAPVDLIFDSVIEPGEDFTITFSPVENATEYWFEIYDQYYFDDGAIVLSDWWDDGAPHTYTLTADQLTPGHGYGIHACAAAYGYDNSDVGTGFVVLPEETDGDIRIFLNEGAGDRTYLVNEKIQVAVTAPANATGILLFQNCDAIAFSRNTVAFETMSFVPTRLVYMAKYTTDEFEEDTEWWKDVTWAGCSAPSILTIHSRGSLSAPAASMANGEVPRGQLAEVIIGNMAEYLDANADDDIEITVTPHRGDREWYYDFRGHWYSGNSVFVPTAGLEAGQTYDLKVEPAVVGWQCEPTELSFTVTEPDSQDHQVYLNLDKTEVVTRERYTVSVYAPGAAAFRLYWSDNGGESWNEDQYADGSGMSWTWDNDRPMELDYAVRACYGDPDNEEDWDELTDSVHISVTAPNGRLDDAHVTLSTRALNVGESLDVTIGYVQFGRHCWIDLCDNDIYEGDDCVYHEDIGHITDTHTETIPAEYFEAGHAYKVWVHVNGEAGYETSDVFESLIVVPQALSDDITLTVNGESEHAEVLINQFFPVCIVAPENATGVYATNGSDFMWNADHEQTARWYTGGEGPDAFIARYTTDDIDPDAEWWKTCEWVGYSNVVTVDAGAYGDMTAPQLDMPEGDVTRGDMLTVGILNAEYYHDGGYEDFGINAAAHDGDELVAGWYDWNGENVMIPTANLQPGEYTLYVDAWAAGWRNGRTETTFTVAEPEIGEDHPIYLTIDRTEALTRENRAVSVYAPGATAFRLYGNGEEREYREGESDVIDWYTGDHPEELDFTVRACYGDPENEEDWGEPSQSVHLSVTAPYGRLNDVTATLSAAALNPGEDLTITVHEVENATEYWFDVHDNDATENNEVANRDARQPFEATISGADLTPGHAYTVWVHAHGDPGYETTDTRYAFMVRPEETAEGFTLYVNGRTEDHDWRVNQNMSLRAFAPAEATGVAVTDGDRIEGQTGNTLDIGWWNHDQPASYAWIARYTTDPIDDPDSDWWNRVEWAGYSNIVTLNVSCDGDLPVPEISLSTDTVARGQWLEITVTNPEAFTTGEYGNIRVEAAPYYEPEDRWFGRWYDWDGQGTIMMPTADLEAGREYTLFVQSVAPGWRTLESAETTFTVTESQVGEGQIVFDMSRTEVDTQDEVAYSIYAPGANAVRLFYNGGHWDGWGSIEDPCDAVTVTCRFDHPDEVDFTPYANWGDPDNEDDWIAGDPVHVSIHAPNGQLAAMPIEYPSQVQPGEDLIVSVGEVENAESFGFEVRDRDVYDRDNWLFSMDGTGTFTVPAALLTPGHRYEINTHAEAPGYESSDNQYGFIVCPDAVSEAITLTVNGDANYAETVIEDNFSVRVEAPEEATGVYVYTGNRSDQTAGNVYDNRDWNFGEPGSVAFGARYTTDDIDPDSEWWRDCQWAGYSNTVTLNVISLGDMPSVAYEASDSVARGDWLEVTVTNADVFGEIDCENFWLSAEIYDPERDEWFGRYDWDAEAATIKLPTAQLETGRTYELHVRAGAYGWMTSEEMNTFEVTEGPDEGVYLNFSKTELLTNERFAVSIYAPGASAMRLYKNENEDRYFDGDTFYEQWDFNHPEEIDYSVSVCYGDRMDRAQQPGAPERHCALWPGGLQPDRAPQRRAESGRGLRVRRELLRARDLV